MKLVRISFFICGMAMLAVGMVNHLYRDGLTNIDNIVLDKIMVSGACEKCVEPEASCPSRGCFSTGMNCQEWDDYWFIEDNSCESKKDMVCVLSDWAACYEVTEYAFPTYGTCATNGCAGSGYSWNEWSWDDCIDGPA